MDIIVVSTTCSEKVYKDIFEKRTRKMIDPMQKFLLQIIRGISSNTDNPVKAVSIVPVSHSCYLDRHIRKFSDQEDNIIFLYPSFTNGIISRFLSTYFSTKKEVKRLIYNKPDAVIITDPLNPYISVAARRVAQRMGNKVVGIITDLPVFATEMKERKNGKLKSMLQKIIEGLSNKDAGKYDGYIFLTESMNSVVNRNNRPYIIVEGTAVLSNMSDVTKKKDKKRQFVYAGGVYSKYGVKRLVEAFIKADLENVELCIYGDGTYVNELLTVCKKHENIRYNGCVLNTELFKIEAQADLLINPRFSDEEYTKYSFPSKTLEYLSSGTAVLSTRLRGIPSEYEPYLYWFDDESLDGMVSTLKSINQYDDNQLDEFGKKGREFAITEKNNNKQGKRIIEFLMTL